MSHFSMSPSLTPFETVTLAPILILLTLLYCFLIALSTSNILKLIMSMVYCLFPLTVMWTSLGKEFRSVLFLYKKYINSAFYTLLVLNKYSLNKWKIYNHLLVTTAPQTPFHSSEASALKNLSINKNQTVYCFGNFQTHIKAERMGQWTPGIQPPQLSTFRQSCFSISLYSGVWKGWHWSILKANPRYLVILPGYTSLQKII